MAPQRDGLAEIDGELLRGLIAGVAATAAMTLSQTMEMKLTGRKPSVAPGEALCLALGIETRTEVEEQRLADEAHWAYGAMWGLGHAALRDIAEPARTLLYFAVVWSAGAALLTSTKLAPPPNEWDTQSLITDLVHHAVFAVAGSLVWHALNRHQTRVPNTGNRMIQRDRALYAIT
jgi:hypothetical protein